MRKIIILFFTAFLIWGVCEQSQASGAAIDPNGRTDTSPYIDPDGAQADSSPYVDPNGFTACIDPNG